MDWRKFNPPPEASDILEHCPKVTVASQVDELVDLAAGDCGMARSFEVVYEVPGKGPYTEAVVARVRNGVAVNYAEPYMRRRDPDCMLIGDDQQTDKETFAQRYGTSFDPVRAEALAWLKTQELLVFGLYAGQVDMSINTLVIAPANAGFFGLSLAMLQGIIPLDEIPDTFHPQAIIYVVPPFRQSHFNGKQVVVHNRLPGIHELFSFNLYPGPSAKKGIYGVLIALGERQGWVAAHCSTVQVVTPYDNVVTLMHEGASGSGKSEMLEPAHREPDGRLLLGENLVTGEKRYLEIPRSCELHPVTDDMALCDSCRTRDSSNGKLHVRDAEDAWFVRVNHIEHYGTDVQLERLTAEPPRPLVFFNLDTVPGGRALIWEHTEDGPGKRCPNPRAVIPRDIVPNIVQGSVSVDIRSLGVRTPPCSREKPSYGIIGLFHLLPPALAWLWRLVVPRGHENPSITGTDGAMQSEGVGSYWPFATGRQVTQANLLLEQFVANPRTRYILTPNQHIGVWRVGFMPQWVAREYLARRGSAKFRPEQTQPARCALLGYTPYELHVEGRGVPLRLIQVDTQPEVGTRAYDEGAEILYSLFWKYLPGFLEADLDPLGRRIIECCFDHGSAQDYQALIHAE